MAIIEVSTDAFCCGSHPLIKCPCGLKDTDITETLHDYSYLVIFINSKKNFTLVTKFSVNRPYPRKNPLNHDLFAFEKNEQVLLKFTKF